MFDTFLVFLQFFYEYQRKQWKTSSPIGLIGNLGQMGAVQRHFVSFNDLLRIRYANFPTLIFVSSEDRLIRRENSFLLAKVKNRFSFRNSTVFLWDFRRSARRARKLRSWFSRRELRSRQRRIESFVSAPRKEKKQNFSFFQNFSVRWKTRRAERRFSMKNLLNSKRCDFAANIEFIVFFTIFSDFSK